MLRLIRAIQPITRTEIARRLDIDKSTVTDNAKPLIAAGVLREETLENTGQGRRPRVLSFVDDKDYFIGVNLGVRHSQVGMTTLKGEITDEVDFETPSNAKTALKMAREHIDKFYKANPDRRLRTIGVSVPGMTDMHRRNLVYAPNLDWRNLAIADASQVNDSVLSAAASFTAGRLFKIRFTKRSEEVS